MLHTSSLPLDSSDSRTPHVEQVSRTVSDSSHIDATFFPLFAGKGLDLKDYTGAKNCSPVLVC